ncbi:MAG: hypothetical protein ABIN91_07755 [Mucilaginibacter sp.]|uniref:hypothetical protein n=1 Tax=Mucilaginibacter sp. TaxID=1882438 RepID=UPI0032677A84
MNSKLFNPIKTKIVATIALLFFVLLGAGTIMAMKSPDKAKAATEKKAAKSTHKNKAKFATLVYSYNLSTSTGARTSTNWTLVSGSGPSCGTAGSIPCKVSFNSADYANIAAYISAQGFASDADVVDGPGVVSKQ